MRTVQTFDKDFSKDLTKETKTLQGLIGQHQKLVISLQKAQEKCWISNSKFNKYGLMVKTAKPSLQYLKGKLIPSEEMSRLKAITDLEKTLKTKQVKKEDAILAPCKPRSKEEANIKQIIQTQKLNNNIGSKIQLEIVDRLESAILTLKDLYEIFLP